MNGTAPPDRIESDPIDAGRRGRRRRLTAEPAREYVAAAPGGIHALVGTRRQELRSLPWSFDDLTRDFGDDLYQRMQYDPQVTANLNVLKSAIIENGPQLAPAVRAEQDGYDQASELVDFCESVIDDMEQPIEEVLWDLLDALAMGSKLAEKVYAYDATYTGKEQLILRRLKVKPRRSVAFVVDEFMNLQGIWARQPGSIGGNTLGLFDAGSSDNLLPVDKFAIVTFRPRDGDPRGSSVLRPAYNAWWLKMQLWPEYLKFLAQFASPSLWGTTPENALPPEEDDEEALTPEQDLLQQLIQFANSSAIALPFGATLQALWSQGEGRAFLAAFEIFNREISKGIVHQTLATDEAKYQPRASAMVHQDTLGRIIRNMKDGIQRTIRQQILRPLVRYNYGPKLERLTPMVRLGDTEAQDFPSVVAAIAQLNATDYLDPSQFPDLDRVIGIPQRSRAELLGRLKAHEEKVKATIKGFERAQEEPDPAAQGNPPGGKPPGGKPAGGGGSKPAQGGASGG